MDSKKKPPEEITDGCSDSKGVRKLLPNQPPDRTSEESGSVVNDNFMNDETAIASPVTTNTISSEQRNFNNSKQELPNEVNKTIKQHALRSGTASFVNANISSAGGKPPKEVPILPNAIVPLRDILEGGMNLGDSHLTNHSSLPKRKQKRTRIPAEDDLISIPPQNSTKAAVTGATLANANQYSVPKTSPRILRENPELENLPIMNTSAANQSGERSIPRVLEIKGQDSSDNDARKEINTEINFQEWSINTPSNNAHGNIVEGLSGRVSFLSKQNTSSKGALEGGNSALNVSKRPKQTGVPKKSLESDASANLPSHTVQKAVPKEIEVNHSELMHASESTQSPSKYKAKERKHLDLPDANQITSSEPKLSSTDVLPLNQKKSNLKLTQPGRKSGIEISSLGLTEEITPKVLSTLNDTVSPNENLEGSSTHQSLKTTQGDIIINNLDATKTKDDSNTPIVSDPKELSYNKNLDHEVLAVPKKSTRKGVNQSEKYRDSKRAISHQKEEVSANVSEASSHQKNSALQQNIINQSSAPLEGNIPSHHSDVLSTRNKDVPNYSPGGSSAPTAADHKERVVSKKNRKLKDEVAKNVFTPPNPGLENHDASTVVGGGHKNKRSSKTIKSDDERNLGYTETEVPHVPKTEPLAKVILGENKQEAKQSTKDQSLGITASSSIIDLPVPNHMNR